MACTRRGDVWRRRFGAIVGHPITALLAIVGVALLVAGVVIDEAALVMIGPGALLLAVLVSVASEFSLGPGGLSLKFRDADREAAFRACAEQLESSLTRAAARLADDPDPLVDEALDRAYVEWDGDGRVLRVHALCTIVRLAVASARLDGREPPYREAVALLRYEQDFEWEAIAAMLELSVEQVRRHVDDVEVAAP